MQTSHSNESGPSGDLLLSIRRQISTGTGSIGFDQFMAAALYTPGLGYYSGPKQKFGACGDFVTAPELTPLFGACLAQQLENWMNAGQVQDIWEFGAGTGQLAAQILNALARNDALPKRYFIVELSAHLRLQQQHTIQTLAPSLYQRVTWVDQLPEAIEGVVLGNELIDAMPVQLFAWDGKQLLERQVAWSTGEDSFVWKDVPANPQLQAEVTLCLTQAGLKGPQELPVPYVSEVHPQAAAWIKALAQRIQTGVLLLLDYGFPAREFYHPQRDQGTLACHYQHRVSFNPFVHVGEQDLTAHVNFTGLDAVAHQAGLDLLGFCSQARFLLNNRLLDLLQPESPDYFKQAQAVGRLVSEAEMGELFKVISWAKATSPDKLDAIHQASTGFLVGGRAL